jgi:predicted phosphodiesterase
MRIAALYDIHGNLPALEAVLQEVRREGVDAIVVGGDVIPGPMPAETLDLLRALDLPGHFIHGNGERDVLAVREGTGRTGFPEAYRPMMEWVASQLRADHVEWIASWPATIDVDECGALFCHATPRSDREIFTRRTPDDAPVMRAFDNLIADVVVCGHTHMQFDRRRGNVRIVNAGSAGMPFQPPGAYWLLMDGAQLDLRRTEYDRVDAAVRIRASAYPQAAEFADGNVVTTPSEEGMVERFARASVK